MICMCTGVWPSALYTVEAAGGMPAVHPPHRMTSELCSPAGAVTCSLMCICCFCEIVLACCLRMSLFIITAYTGAFPYVLASSLSAFLKHLLPLINQSLRSVRFRGTIEVLQLYTHSNGVGSLHSEEYTLAVTPTLPLLQSLAKPEPLSVS